MTRVCPHCKQEVPPSRNKKAIYCSPICSKRGGMQKIRDRDPEGARTKHKEHRRNNPERSLVNAARQRAKLKWLPFDIEWSDIVIPEECPVLKIPLILNEKVTGPNSPSLDKINPTLGYVKGNIRVISHRANTIKSNATASELEAVFRDLKKLEGKAET